jgi:hypothetical protein
MELVTHEDADGRPGKGSRSRSHTVDSAYVIAAVGAIDAL